LVECLPRGIPASRRSLTRSRKRFLALAILTPEVVQAFHQRCGSFKESNDDTPFAPCMGCRIGAEENPFGGGAKDGP
jgi:hypothetical protein